MSPRPNGLCFCTLGIRLSFIIQTKRTLFLYTGVPFIICHPDQTDSVSVHWGSVYHLSPRPNGLCFCTLGIRLSFVTQTKRTLFLYTGDPFIICHPDQTDYVSVHWGSVYHLSPRPNGLCFCALGIRLSYVTQTKRTLFLCTGDPFIICHPDQTDSVSVHWGSVYHLSPRPNGLCFCTLGIRLSFITQTKRTLFLCTGDPFIMCHPDQTDSVSVHWGSVYHVSPRPNGLCFCALGIRLSLA